MTGRDVPRAVPGGVFVPAPLARRLLEWLLPILHDRVRASRDTLELHADVRAFLAALHAADVVSTRTGMSDFGPVEVVPATVVDMKSSLDAAREVGLTDRHVRRLCARGLVAHQRTSTGRYFVDVESLKVHLRGEGGAAA